MLDFLNFCLPRQAKKNLAQTPKKKFLLGHKKEFLLAMKRSMLDDNDDDHCAVIASPPVEIAAELTKAYMTLPFYPERCPKLILISGKYDTGKDTLALALKKYFEMQGMHVQHEKFADALKEAAAIITGERKVDQYTDEGKAKMIDSLGMTIGRFQQVYGTVLR